MGKKIVIWSEIEINEKTPHKVSYEDGRITGIWYKDFFYELHHKQENGAMIFWNVVKSATIVFNKA